MKSTKLFITSILALVFLASLSSCRKKDKHDIIPEVAVNIQIDIGSTMYIDLNTIGGYIYLTGGYKGIIVYRVSTDDFVAYDRACPYDPFLADSRISVDPSGITLSDTCCGSRFNILDGSTINGPATIPLKRYYTYFDGNVLTINN